MGISLKPLACNGLCKSCYENKIREYGGQVIKSDYSAMFSTWKKMVKEGKRQGFNPPVIHGGEPLMIPIPWLEKFLRVAFEEYGRTSLQTNGVLLNAQHLDLFKKYKASVGVSIDGPTAEMNYGRWNSGGLDLKTIQALTDKTLANIKRLRDEGIPVSIIVLLRKYNATAAHLRRLRAWALTLYKEDGIKSIRFNPVIVFDKAQQSEEELSGEELARAWKVLCREIFRNPELSWSPCRDFVEVITGGTQVVCFLRSCDPWHTIAEIPVLGSGALGNCMHGGAAIDGIPVLRTTEPLYVRDEILQQTPQEAGGCKNCPWWPFCKGGCPGAGMNNDWRNRTRFCKAYKIIFAELSDLLRGFFSGWKPGDNPIKKIENNHPGHGDQYVDWHGDRPHGDHTDGG